VPVVRKRYFSLNQGTSGKNLTNLFLVLRNVFGYTKDTYEERGELYESSTAGFGLSERNR
jgi:hypothetical protein